MMQITGMNNINTRLQNYRSLNLMILTIVAAASTSCSSDEFDMHVTEESAVQIRLSGEINQLAVTRVNDSGFTDGDKIGIYVVDYEGDTPGVLKNQGNRADNVAHQYDGASGEWIPE